MMLFHTHVPVTEYVLSTYKYLIRVCGDIHSGKYFNLYIENIACTYFIIHWGRWFIILVWGYSKIHEN